MIFKVECWYGLHTGGTKFYQVLRFVSPADTSFAIGHYGPAATFTGMGKIGAGQCDLAQSVSIDTKAGTAKIREKRDKKGYSDNQQSDIFTFADLSALKAWCRSNLNDKGRKLAYAEIDKSIFSGPSTVTDPDDALARLAKMGDEPGAAKHEDWATW